MLMTTNQPIDVACALIARDGRLLLARRPPDKALGGKWEFPGGKVEPGESAPDALRREIAEELAVSITVGQPLPPVVHDYGAFAIRLIPFVCRLDAGTPIPHEHTDVRWIPPSSVAAMDIADADRPVIQAYLRLITSQRERDSAREDKTR